MLMYHHKVDTCFLGVWTRECFDCNALPKQLDMNQKENYKTKEIYYTCKKCHKDKNYVTFNKNVNNYTCAKCN